MMRHYIGVLGLALTVTGIIALAHHFSRSRGRLPDVLRNDTLSPRAEFVVAVVLVVVGLTLLLAASNIT